MGPFECENAEVAVHGEDELVFGHRGSNAHGNVTHPAEPFDFALPQLRHHLFFNHSGKGAFHTAPLYV